MGRLLTVCHTNGDMDMVKILIEQGAGVNAVCFGVLDDQVCAEY